MFDNYLMVDWSSSMANKNVGEDSIWLAWFENDQQIKFSNPSNRAKALIEINNLLNNIQGRTIVGFDFPFGYPADAYKGFDCNNWRNLWNLIQNEIMDNGVEKNRFKVAGELNNRCFGNLFESNDPYHGPFWGHPQPNNRRFTGLPFNMSEDYDRYLLAGKKLPSKFRHIENAIINQRAVTNPNPVWQLSGRGSVGSQTLMGIPTLHKLNKRDDCLVWPFEDLEDGKHVIAEIFPSIWKSDEEDKRHLGLVKDAGQVKTVAEQILCHDRNGTLKDLLAAPRIYERDNKTKKGDITEKEGWILGVDEEGKVAEMITDDRPELRYV